MALLVMILNNILALICNGICIIHNKYNCNDLVGILLITSYSKLNT